MEAPLVSNGEEDFFDRGDLNPAPTLASDAEERLVLGSDWSSPLTEEAASVQLMRIINGAPAQNLRKYMPNMRGALSVTTHIKTLRKASADLESKSYLRVTLKGAMKAPMGELQWKQSDSAKSTGVLGLQFKQAVCITRPFSDYRCKKWCFNTNPDILLVEIYTVTPNKRQKPDTPVAQQAKSAHSDTSQTSLHSASASVSTPALSERVRFDDPNHALAIYGSVFASEGFFHWSDETVKDNVKPLIFGLGQLMSLSPVSYNYKGSAEMRAGFIAQELQRHCSGVVTTMSDGKLAVDSLALISLIVSGVKDFVQRTNVKDQRLHELLRKLEIEYQTASEASASEAEAVRRHRKGSANFSKQSGEPKAKSSRPQPQKTSEPEDAPFACQVSTCGRAYATHRELSTHRNKYAHWVCAGCNAAVESKERRKIHQESYQHVMHTCRVCNSNFDSGRALDEHRLQSRHYGCSQCNQKYPNPAALTTHARKAKHFDSDNSDPETRPPPATVVRHRRDDSSNDGEDENEYYSEGDDEHEGTDAEGGDEHEQEYQSGSDGEPEPEEEIAVLLAQAEESRYSAHLLVRLGEDAKAEALLLSPKNPNFDSAIAYLWSAARKGSVVALRHLGHSFAYNWTPNGFQGVEESTKRHHLALGEALMRQAAEGGDTEAMRFMFRFRTIAQDPEEAGEFLRQAAALSDHEAECELGDYLCNGFASTPFEFDFLEALYWFRRAAPHHPTARKKLDSFDPSWPLPSTFKELNSLLWRSELLTKISATVSEYIPKNGDALIELTTHGRVHASLAKRALALNGDDITTAYEWLVDELGKGCNMGELCVNSWSEEETATLLAALKTPVHQVPPPLVLRRVSQQRCTIDAGAQKQFTQKCPVTFIALH